MDPHNYRESTMRAELEKALEGIISRAAFMADSPCTRDDRRERIVAECNAVRQALQDLLTEYMDNVSFLFFSFFTISSIDWLIDCIFWWHWFCFWLFFFFWYVSNVLALSFSHKCIGSQQSLHEIIQNKNKKQKNKKIKNKK